MDFLKELFALRAIKEDEEEVNASDMKVDDQVHQQLDDAAEDDEMDAQCFGLEMEDGKVVKVYVKQEDAENFEKAMSEKLGESDDIKAALEELEKDFEILKIVWPDEDQEGEDDDEDKDDDDGSESMNDEVDYDDDEEGNPKAKDEFKNEQVQPLSYGQSFAKRIMELKWSDEDSKEYSNASPKDDENSDEEGDDKGSDSNGDGSSEDQSNEPKAIEDGWNVEKEEDGSLEISNKRFKVELDPDEAMELVNKIVDKQVARFKNEQGKIVYVFQPRGGEYVLKTPQFQGGFRIPKDIVKKLLDE